MPRPRIADAHLDDALPKLCDLLRSGNFLKPACRMLRLDPNAAFARLKRAEGDDASDTDLEFAAELEAARAEAEIDHVKLLLGGSKNWQAFAWWLARARPERWGEAAAAMVAAGQVDRATIQLVLNQRPEGRDNPALKAPTSSATS